MTIRLLIADDHPIVRDGLKKLLLLEDDFEVVGEAADGREVLEKVRELDPDVLLLDLRMPNLDGLSTLQALQQVNKRTRIIILTASEDKNEFVQAMKLGCSGIVLKQTAPDLIVKSIRKVNSGEIWLDSHTTAAVMWQFSTGLEGSGSAQGGKGRGRSPLSTREREIVAFVAQGYKNKEMAEKMFISEQTVKNHLHNIFDKLGVSDRLELTLYAIHEGTWWERTTPEETAASPRREPREFHSTADQCGLLESVNAVLGNPYPPSRHANSGPRLHGTGTGSAERG